MAPDDEIQRVPNVNSKLPPLNSVQILWLRRVAGPLRRRFWKVDPNPPPPLSGPEILDRVASMPVSTWSYEFEPGIRHLGPMSQDFAATFGLGRTNRMINMVDANGVNVVAIQALVRRVQRLENEVARLQADVDRGSAAPS